MLHTLDVLLLSGCKQITYSCVQTALMQWESGFLRAAASVGGLMDARHSLVLFAEHDGFRSDQRAIAVA